MSYLNHHAPDPQAFDRAFDEAIELGYDDLAIIPSGLDKGGPKEVRDYRKPASISYLMGIYDAIEHSLDGIRENVFDQDDLNNLESALDNRAKMIKQYIEKEKRTSSLKSDLLKLGAVQPKLQKYIKPVLDTVLAARDPASLYREKQDDIRLRLGRIDDMLQQKATRNPQYADVNGLGHVEDLLDQIIRFLQ